MKECLGVVAAAALLFTACGSDASSEHAHSHDDRHDHGMSATDVTWGEPAEPSAADRTVEIAALDSYRFEPATVRAQTGDTIRFVVTNKGDLLHEFFLGTADEQLAHRTEMGAGGMHHDSELMVELPPGLTKELTWTFTESGTVHFGCHVDDHFSRGMVGAVEISG